MEDKSEVEIAIEQAETLTFEARIASSCKALKDRIQRYPKEPVDVGPKIIRPAPDLELKESSDTLELTKPDQEPGRAPTFSAYKSHSKDVMTFARKIAIEDINYILELPEEENQPKTSYYMSRKGRVVKLVSLPKNSPGEEIIGGPQGTKMVKARTEIQDLKNIVATIQHLRSLFPA